MRAADDDRATTLATLRTLQRWGPLPESDVTRMLRQRFLVTDDYRDMTEEGLIDMVFAGDEYVLSLTTLGRLFLEQANQGNADPTE